MARSDAVLEYIQSVVYGRRRGATASVALLALRGLSAAYRLGLRLYLAPFELGVRPRRHLPCPVVSIGNLTVGGTGKTPVTRYLCEGLLRRGWRPAVLSYGYGGSLGGRFGVVSTSDRVLLAPQEAGDEPVMLASQLPGTPVLVGKDRGRSGKHAVERFGADIAVLDDGFQVWKLHRDLDIVLVDGSNPFDNSRTLPAGKLREPAAALRRARCIVAMGVRPEEEVCKGLVAKVLQIAPGASMFCARYVPHALFAIGDGAEVELGAIRGQNVFAFCSIANPSSFGRTLEEAGAVIVGKEHFPDHYRYAPADISHIEENARASAARFVVTTEKDGVKLKNVRMKLPLLTLEIRLLLDEEPEFWRIVEDALTACSAVRSDGRNV